MKKTTLFLAIMSIALMAYAANGPSVQPTDPVLTEFEGVVECVAPTEAPVPLQEWVTTWTCYQYVGQIIIGYPYLWDDDTPEMGWIILHGTTDPDDILGYYNEANIMVSWMVKHNNETVCAGTWYPGNDPVEPCPECEPIPEE